MVYLTHPGGERPNHLGSKVIATILAFALIIVMNTYTAQLTARKVTWQVPGCLVFISLWFLVQVFRLTNLFISSFKELPTSSKYMSKQIIYKYNFYYGLFPGRVQFLLLVMSS